MTDSFDDAVTAHPEGTVIAVLITTGAKENHLFISCHPWRKALECRIRAPAIEGKANRELILQCAERLCVPQNAIRILTGHRSGQKKILLRGKSREDVLQIQRSMEK